MRDLQQGPPCRQIVQQNGLSEDIRIAPPFDELSSGCGALQQPWFERWRKGVGNATRHSYTHSQALPRRSERPNTSKRKDGPPAQGFRIQLTARESPSTASRP